jgi:hypothetical protein
MAVAVAVAEAVAVSVAVAVAVSVAVVKATPNLLPNSKARLWDLHSLFRLAKVKVMVTVMVKVTDSPSTTS